MLRHTSEPFDDREPAPMDVARSAGALVRLVVLIAGCGVLLFGLWCGWNVFMHVRTIVTGGKGLEDALRPLAAAIRADDITVPVPGREEGVPIGHSLALMLLFVWNILFAWLPVLMIKTGAWLMMTSLPDRNRSKSPAAGTQSGVKAVARSQ